MYRRKNIIKKFIALLLSICIGASTAVSGVTVSAAEAGTTGDMEERGVHLYYNFYDSASGNTDKTIGCYADEVKGKVENEQLNATINPEPDYYDYGEVNGFPKVYLGYASVGNEQRDITQECVYDAVSGQIQIPEEYKDEYITVKVVMSDTSNAYDDFVPNAYKVTNKSEISARMPGADSQFEVIPGSSNDIQGKGDYSAVNVGDVITLNAGFIINLTHPDYDTTYDFYNETGTQAYKGYKGEYIGYALCFLDTSNPLFNELGAIGTGGNTTANDQTVNFAEHHWIYARCISEVNNQFDGNPFFSGGKIMITGKDVDGTLHCWVEVYANGPYMEAAQSTGLYFDVHPPKAGKVQIQKLSANPTLTDNNNCYSLAGAEYGVYSDPACTQKVATLKTDAKGNTTSVEVDAGTYYVKEIKAPKGFELDKKVHSVKVESNKTAIAKLSDVPGNDPAAIEINKIDAETGAVNPQGGASLEGAQFTVKYYDGYYTLDKLPNRATKTWILETKSVKNPVDGTTIYGTRLADEYKVKGDEFYELNNIPTLPLGTISIQETKAPKGYLLENSFLQGKGDENKVSDIYVTQITDSKGVVKVVGGNEYSVSDYVVRGDLEFIKNNFEKDEPMENIPFSITSKTTGESHIIVTDKDGHASTASSHNKHSVQTNRGEQSTDGVWFGTDVVDDSKGALPYDTYIVSEQQCEGNKGKDLVEFEVVVSENDIIVDQGVVTNKTINLRTNAIVLETGSKNLPASGQITVVDTVSYENLTPGRTYTFEGTIIDKSTKEALLIDGKQVSVKQDYAVTTENGTVEIPFELAAAKVKDKTLVVFEKVFYKDMEFASHEDINDTDQTLYAPSISTSALDASTNEQQAVTGKTTITDKVAYSNLEPGKEYTVKGKLMDKSTGKPLVVNKKEVIAEKRFTAKTENGYVNVEFILDSSELKGRTSVVFEELYQTDKLIAIHAESNDTKQTIYIPEIKTTAKDCVTLDKQLAVNGKATVIDTVEYKNLIPGKKYTMKGTLMDKATGKGILIKGKKVTAETAFTPQKAEGSVEVKFVFDATGLNGETLVIFEGLMMNGIEVTTHADLKDEGQTIYVPHIKTTATDKNTGSHIAGLSEKETFVDLVDYKNLVVGKEYKIKGVLMSKDAKKPVTINGKKVTAQVKFTPKASSGNVKLEYTIDTTTLAGDTVVVFEDLYYGKDLVYSHSDIEDKDQSIYIPKIGTTAVDKADGDHEVVAANPSSIIDIVKYENLVAGRNYKIVGKLMDKTSGKPLQVNGKEVTVEKIFGAGKTDGSEEMGFSFNGVDLVGKDVVVFERIYTDKGILVAVHEDINDKDQTVRLVDRETFKVGPIKTGDDTPIMLFVFASVLAIVGIGTIVVTKKRSKKDKASK